MYLPSLPKRDWSPWQMVFHCSSFGGFHRWGYPSIFHINEMFPYKPTIIGYHHDYANPHIPSYNFENHSQPGTPAGNADGPHPSRRWRRELEDLIWNSSFNGWILGKIYRKPWFLLFFTTKYRGFPWIFPSSNSVTVAKMEKLVLMIGKNAGWNVARPFWAALFHGGDQTTSGYLASRIIMGKLIKHVMKWSETNLAITKMVMTWGFPEMTGYPDFHHPFWLMDFPF